MPPERDTETEGVPCELRVLERALSARAGLLEGDDERVEERTSSCEVGPSSLGRTCLHELRPP